MINIRYLEDYVTTQSDCARRYLSTSTCQGHRMRKVAWEIMANHMARKARISWRREKKGKFHDSSQPLGGRGQ